MITEGIGQTAPKPVVETMSDREMRHLYQASIERAEHRGYRAKRGTWEQGLKSTVVLEGVGSLTPDIRPIFAGLMGEYGSSVFLNRRLGTGRARVDLRLTRLGDFGIDLTIYGLTMQIKTRQSPKWGNLIRRVNARGAVLSLPSDGFVFCEWPGYRDVSILGWLWTKSIVRRETVPAIYGDWRNIEVSDDELLPPCRLVDELQSRKLALS